MTAEALRDQIGKSLDNLLSLGALRKGQLLSNVVCRSCFEGHTATVEYDVKSQQSWIICPEAGRVAVDDCQLETVQLNPEWLPDQLARALNVNPTPPRRTLINGAAWWLGDTLVGQTVVSVALAIGVRGSATVQQLVNKLGNFAPLNLGLLLAVGDPVPAYVSDLTQYHPISIEDMVRADDKLIGIDRPHLEAWVRGVLRGRGGPAASFVGRPPRRSQVLILFNERRQRGEPYASKLSEAQEIVKEWRSRFPDEAAPNISTVRSHLPNPNKRA